VKFLKWEIFSVGGLLSNLKQYRIYEKQWQDFENIVSEEEKISHYFLEESLSKTSEVCITKELE
jgi:hypothetical protein